jgi:hypothetical protein
MLNLKAGTDMENGYGSDKDGKGCCWYEVFKTLTQGNPDLDAKLKAFCPRNQLKDKSFASWKTRLELAQAIFGDAHVKPVVWPSLGEKQGAPSVQELEDAFKTHGPIFFGASRTWDFGKSEGRPEPVPDRLLPGGGSATAYSLDAKHEAWTGGAHALLLVGIDVKAKREPRADKPETLADEAYNVYLRDPKRPSYLLRCSHTTFFEGISQRAFSIS